MQHIVIKNLECAAQTNIARVQKYFSSFNTVYRY